MSNVLEELYDNINTDFDRARVTDAKDEDYKGDFRITDQGGAIWALRKMKLIDSRFNEVKGTAMAEIDKIQSWVKDEEEKAARSRGYFEALLRDYMLTLKEADPKLKTLSLPGGKLAFRKLQPEYTYIEEDILPWAKENLPEAVQVKESILKTPIKEHIKETGEYVPGVTIEERPDKFIVEVL